MAEDSGLKALVAEEVSERLDVTDLLDGGSLEDGIDGGEIGASVGRQFGERVGSELGAAIGLKLHETIAEGVEQEKDLGEIRSDIVAAVRDAFGETVEDLEVADSLAPTSEDEEAEESPDEDEAGGAEGEDADEGDGDEESAEDAADEDEAAEEDAEQGEPSAEDLEGLRRETLEEFLSIMSYSDLQSVAKDVGVKANLSREEMTERIVETVTESDDELAAAANEEGS